MNQKIRSLLALTVAAGFPFVVAAQSSTSGSSATSGSTSGQSSTSRGTSLPGSQHNSGSMSSTGSSHGDIRRVTQDSLDRQLTAKGLIGKDVYDSQGEKIGEVEDVVLDTSRAPQLATAFSSRQADGSSLSSGASASGSTAGVTGSSVPGSTYAGTTSDRPATSTNGSPSSDSLRSATSELASAADRLGSAMQSSMEGAAAIISSGGLFSRNELVRVPLSQLNYDARNDRITLAVSRSEFSSLSEPSEVGNAAE